MVRAALRSAALAGALALSGAVAAQTTGKPPERLGTVNFPNSCKPEAQAVFTRAVALLHSFWWQEGERAFRRVLELDPGCAIADWGIATILIGNTFAAGPTPARAKEAVQAIEQGRAVGPKTERERYFLEAVAEYYYGYDYRTHPQRIKALSDAFQQVAARFPEDDEAQIFNAIYLTATQDPTEKTFASALKAASILEEQFRKHPDHPGVAHYLIHSYDYPPIADKGLGAARRYSAIAPSAPHAQHMPSHIFTRVGAWEDSAASNERSASIAKSEKEFVDQLHAMDYMEYAYLQLGRDADARRVVEEAPLVAAAPPAQAAPYALAAIPARFAVERGAWREAAQLRPQSSRFAFTTAFTHFARALGAARSGDAAGAEQDVAELARIAEGLKAQKNAYWATEVEVQRRGAAAWAAFAAGKRDEALDLMRAAAALEDTSEKSAISPGRLVPAHELLGDMLLEAGRPAEALAEFERSQLRDPRRFRSLYGAGLAAERSGNRDKAKYFYGRLVEITGARGEREELARARKFLAGA